MPKKRYIILARNVFSARDWDRLGCQLFSDNGYEVVPLNCANIAFPGVGDRLETKNNASDPRSYRMESCEDVVRIINTCGEGDLILMLLRLTPESAPIYESIRRRKVNYVVLNFAILPWTLDPGAIFGLRTPIKAAIQDLRNRLYRTKVTLLRILALRWRFFTAPAPRWWIRSGCGADVIMGEYPKLWQAEVLPCNSFEWGPQGKDTGSCRTNGAMTGDTAVFIDAAAISHPEWRLEKGGSPINADRYFSAMRRVFDHVEQKFGVTVVIAAHPRAEYEENDPCFGGRKIVWGETNALIRDAPLVLNHHGTSVSTAVYYRKPIIFLTNDDYETTRYRWWSYCMHSWLNQPRINIDRDVEVARLDMRPVDEKLYRRYERHFLVEGAAEPGPPWPALMETFERTLQS